MTRRPRAGTRSGRRTPEDRSLARVLPGREGGARRRLPSLARPAAGWRGTERAIPTPAPRPPPTVGPRAPPRPTAAPQIPRADPRSSSGKCSRINASAFGASAAAPRPWSARRDHLPWGGGDGREPRADREHDLAEHVEPPPTHGVPESAETDHERGEGEVVARQHPLHRAQADAELLQHRDRRDVEDAAVQHGEHRAEQHGPKNRPAE